MKKVINIGKVPKRLLALAIAITMIFGAAACSKKNGAASNDKGAPAASASNLPEGTPSPAEATPTVNPEVVEAELIEKSAEEEYKNLLATKTEGFIYPFGYDEVVKHIQISRGNFVGLAEKVAGLDPTSIEYEIALADYRDVEFLLYLSSYGTNISIAATNIDRGDKSTKIIGSQFNNFFKNADGTDMYGVDTLKIMETLAKDVYDSYSADWDTFKVKAEAFQEFVATVFPESRNAWEGKSISSFSYIAQFNNQLGWHLQTVATSCLGAIFTKAGGEKISTPNNPCFTTQFLLNDLTEKNHIVTAKEATPGCPEGTHTNQYALMLSTLFRGEMIKDIERQNNKAESTPGPTLTYTPSN